MRCPKCLRFDYSITSDRAVHLGANRYELVFHCRCGKQLFGEDNIRAEHVRQWEAYVADCRRAGLTPDEFELRREEERRQAEENRKAQERLLEETRARTLAAARKAREDAKKKETAKRLEWLKSLERKSRLLPAAKQSVQPAPNAEDPSCPSPSQTDPSSTTTASTAAPFKAPARSRTASVSASPLPGLTGTSSPSSSSTPSVQISTLSPTERCAWPVCNERRSGESKYCSRACSNKNSHMRADIRKLVAKSYDRSHVIREVHTRYGVETSFVEKALDSQS
jgi:hypothetical protein